MNKPLEVIIVGAGNRAMIYAQYAKREPDKMKIVGVVDPNPKRRDYARDTYGFSNDMCFESVEELCSHEKLADAIINGTMDKDHVPTTTQLLRKGYDVLLEKPFCINEEEMYALKKVADEENRKVMICHVLRYAPFYNTIKRLILDGEIGEIYNIQLQEHVSYHHTVAAFVRGKWASPVECYAPMLLAKSCHDLDLLMWMMEGATPVSIASFGGDFNYVNEKKPANAGTRCLVDCPMEKECYHSAKRNYLTEEARWGAYVWADFGEEYSDPIYGANPPMEEKIKSLETDNPFGRCVWDCKRDGNVDHQSVIVNFDNGATATFNMTGNTAKGERNIHIIGTKGEIKGVFDESTFVIRKHVPEVTSPEGYTEELIDVNVTGDMTGMRGGHGGGDGRVPEDFVNFVRGEEASIACTSLDKSILGHLAVFRAEKSRKEKKMVPMFD